MLTKRLAILAIFSGVLAKMAHADDPNWRPSTPGDWVMRTTPNSVEMNVVQQPTVWTVNLNQMKSLDVILDGKTATISPAEIFAALITP